MPRLSPVKLSTYSPFVKAPWMVFHKWVAQDWFMWARFSRRVEDSTAELFIHPSTKSPGSWQMTYFVDGLPTGDSRGELQALLLEASPKLWRLREAAPIVETVAKLHRCARCHRPIAYKLCATCWQPSYHRQPPGVFDY